MSVEVQDLSTLDPELVRQADEELTALVQEANPNLELRSGTLHDLLIHVKAQLEAATQTNIQLVRQSSSLQAVEENPELADDDIVDNLLSNYNLERQEGVQATGFITVVIDELVGVVIPQGSVWTMNGLEFTASATTAARTNPSAVIDENDVLITEINGTGEYQFSFPAIATEVGSAGNVARATTATPDAEPNFFLRGFAASDFTGGQDPETNEELLTKLDGGLAIKAWANRPSVEGLLRDQEAFRNIEFISIIGFGDSEMIRDQHAIWPGSLGGRADLYLRSEKLYQNVTVEKEATLISKVGSVGRWQVGIGLNDAPGFYDMAKALLLTQDQSAAGFGAVSDTRSLDLISSPSNVLPPPDLVDVEEGVYSRYQAAVITFDDTITDATALVVGVATQDYNIVLRTMPLVADVQDFLNERSQRPPMNDVTVKAPIPCFTTIAFTLNYDDETDAPDVEEIQNAVAESVNCLGFVGKLPRSLIDQTLHDLLDNIVSATDYTISGNIRLPDGTITFISDPQELVIPDDSANMSTGRTTVFFLQPSDVTVTLNPVDTPDV